MTGQVAELREQLELARRQDPNPNPSKRGDPNPSIAVFSNTDPLTLHEGVSQDREWVGFEEEGRHAGGAELTGRQGRVGSGGVGREEAAEVVGEVASEMKSLLQLLAEEPLSPL
jgi:hypothetical protein